MCVGGRKWSEGEQGEGERGDDELCLPCCSPPSYLLLLPYPTVCLLLLLLPLLQVTSSDGFSSPSLTAKHATSDSTAILKLENASPTTVQLSYHQAVHPRWTLGGYVSTDLAQVVPLPQLTPQMTAGIFGSYSNKQGNTSVLWKVDPANQKGTLRYWHAPARELVLGTALTVNTQNGTQLSDSLVSVGARMNLGKELSGQHSSTLTVEADSAMKVQIGWQRTSMPALSSTQMNTMISGSFDQKKRDFRVGCSFQFFY